VFDSVVAGTFQIIFRAKMHVNDVFLFLKNYFWHQHIKTIQNIQIILNFSKKKKFNFLGMQPQPRSHTWLLDMIKKTSYQSPSYNQFSIKSPAYYFYLQDPYYNIKLLTRSLHPILVNVFYLFIELPISQQKNVPISKQ
jgi:hypothetical protein